MTEGTANEKKRLELRHREEADDEILALLGKTVLGTEGGLRYSLKDITRRMKFYGRGLSFVGLYKKDNLAGVIGRCDRITTTGGKEYKTTFLRYLSVRGSFQISKVSDHQTEKLNRIEDSFKQKIFSMFSKPVSIPGTPDDSSEPHLVYACVESENERSRNFVRQTGYEHIRSFATVAFSRFRPKKQEGVVKLTPGEEPEMAKLLAVQYRDYSFYTGDFSFLEHRYYVLKRDEKIVAGALALPTVFKVEKYPGFNGWLMTNILPFFQWFRHIFRDGEFNFLVLDSVYCHEGSEHLIPVLFESVCAMEGFRAALTWQDADSKLCKSLQSTRGMGLLNKLFLTKPGIVYASFSNVSPEEKKNIRERPVYLAGIDFV